LDADETGYELGFYRVAYDYQAVIDIVMRINHPARKFITGHLLGEMTVDL
jgi:hypothetical protein